VALFDIGGVFRPGQPGEDLPDEREVLSVAIAGASAPEAVRTLRMLLGLFHLEETAALEPAEVPGLHPTRTASVLVRGRRGGAVGEVDPDVLAAHSIIGPVAWLELELDAVLPADRQWVQAQPVSRFPSSDIDLAFAVEDDTPAAAVEATLRSAAGPLLERLWLFDVYRGPGMPAGQRSLAYRLRFQAQDRTLTDQDVAAARAACITAVEATHPAKLRA
jgi:phenylalanyl-tRNA synthetase beta chain